MPIARPRSSLLTLNWSMLCERMSQVAAQMDARNMAAKTVTRVDACARQTRPAPKAAMVRR